MPEVITAKGGARVEGLRLFKDPELEDGVDSRLLRPVFLTGVELFITGDSVEFVVAEIFKRKM